MIIGTITGATVEAAMDQPEYQNLPLRIGTTTVGNGITQWKAPMMESLWFPEADELANLNAGAGITLQVLGNRPPPVRLDVKPEDGMMPIEPSSDSVGETNTAPITWEDGIEEAAKVAVGQKCRSCGFVGDVVARLQQNNPCCEHPNVDGATHEEVQAAIRSISPVTARVAEDFVLVPKEPTPEMNLAGTVVGDYPWDGQKPSRVYRAMLAAAPTPSSLKSDRKTGEPVAALTLAKLPAHKCGLTIEHNNHLNVYETVAQYTSDEDRYSDDDWVSLEEKAKAIKTNELWTMQWYPDTPVGFCYKAASSFEALVKYMEDNPDA